MTLKENGHRPRLVKRAIIYAIRASRHWNKGKLGIMAAVLDKERREWFSNKRPCPRAIIGSCRVLPIVIIVRGLMTVFSVAFWERFRRIGTVLLAAFGGGDCDIVFPEGTSDKAEIRTGHILPGKWPKKSLNLPVYNCFQWEASRQRLHVSWL